MRISESKISMHAESSQYASHRREEKLELSFRPAPSMTEQRNAPSGIVDISDEARAASSKGAASRTGEKQLNREAMRLQMLIDIIERITGRKIELFDASELSEMPAGAEPSAAEDTNAGKPEWSVHFERREVHEEAEEVHFSAGGKVKTSDGREIDFSLELHMQRYERHATTTTIDAGTPQRKDPLILNLHGGIAQLEGARFDFDLDGDGRAESIAKPGSGSFFLALDRNGNGKIDDGSELFGPQSGDGFAELAQLDADANGWIDENDAAFRKLSVWRGGALQSLTTAGVGAIALQQVATPLALREGGDDRGRIQASGIFLKEDGTPGTIQHVDLTV